MARESLTSPGKCISQVELRAMGDALVEATARIPD